MAGRRQEGKSAKEFMRCLKRHIARKSAISPSTAAGTRRRGTPCTAKSQSITVQTAADNLPVWPAALFRLERGQTRDDAFHQRYEDWLDKH
ncbi:hypothetical protein J2S94_003355 [Arthrobacter bambusae]|nr:hypothetical protein [Arthrobacter bambusae]